LGSLFSARVENWVSLKSVLKAIMLHFFIIPHVQTQSNLLCNVRVILMWLMLQRDHILSRCLYRNNTYITPNWFGSFGGEY
jgi:hypothetical protein